MKQLPVGIIALASLSCLLLSGCNDADSAGVSSIIAGLNTGRYQASEQTASVIHPLMDAAYGEDLVYVSPEAERAMLKDNETFAANVIVPAQQKDVAKFLRGGAKLGHSAQIDPKLDLLKARFGTWYGSIPPRMLRDLVWDDAKLNAVLTDDGAAWNVVVSALELAGDWSTASVIRYRDTSGLPSYIDLLGPAVTQVSGRTGS